MEFFGLHLTLNSWHMPFTFTCAIPLFVSIVVNGKGAIFAGFNVAALKKVVLPVFGLPTSPAIIGIYSSLIF